MADRTASALLESALTYSARGWHVLPCHTPVGRGCSCRRNCGSIGKHPRTKHGVKDATTDEATIRRWWRMWPQANLGIATGAVSQLVVLDNDSYKGGDVSLDDLEHSYGRLPATIQQITGGGGMQYFFRHPGTPVKNGVETLGHGLDIRGDGGYVIAPPSLHASGRQYVWEYSCHPDDTPLAPCPDWLQALTRTQGPATTLDASATIPQGQRNAQLFKLGCAMRARGFAEVAIHAALDAINMTQCQEPLEEDEVQRIAASCARYPAGHTRNGMSPPADIDEEERLLLAGQRADRPQPLAAATAPWREFLITNKQGKPSENASNIGLILANHPAWQEAFWWDSVRSTPMFKELPMESEHITEIAQWLGVTEGMPVRSLGLLERCIIAQCKKAPKDLLQHWLYSLPAWDHIPRLDDWLSDIAGTTKNAYGIAVSRILPLSMVARALDPGCLYRYVVILEGPEESGKSSLVRALAGEGWYVELAIGLETKESHMMLHGAWVAELSELDSLGRTEETRLKAFITLKEDSYIPKYSNYRITSPRRTIFIGTTNEECYLKGQTGNTRFLPIKVGMIDLAAFHALREQLFAEALHVYQQDPAQWWRFSEEALEEAAEERERRRLLNVYEQDLNDWLEVRRFQESYQDGYHTYAPVRDETSWQDIARWYLKIDTPERWKDMNLQKQIASALKFLGWHNSPIWRNGKTTRIWVKDENTHG